MPHLNLPSIIQNLLSTITCPICLERISSPQQLKCTHIFCKLCLVEAMKLKEQCPLCAHKTLKKDLHDSPYYESLILSISKLVDALASQNKEIDPKTGSNSSSDVHSTNPIPLTVDNEQKLQELKSALRDVPSVTFLPGDIVTVLPRTWPGMNKPGGAAWVTFRHEDDGSYDVRYVVSSQRDSKVPSMFVQSSLEIQLERSQRSRHSRTDVSSTPQSNISTSTSTPIKRKRSKTTTNVSVPLSETEERSCKEQRKLHQHHNDDGYDDNRNGNDTRRSRLTTSTATTAAAMSSEHHIKTSKFSTIYILTTALSETDKKTFNSIIAELVCKLPTIQITIENHYSDWITHTIVSTDRKFVVESRTMKYMQALIAGKWIVSIDWLVESLATGTLLDEEPYEVIRDKKAVIDYAPKRCRETVVKGDPRIFHDVIALLLGSFPSPGPPRSALEGLIAVGSGLVVTAAADLWSVVNLLIEEKNLQRYRIVGGKDLRKKIIVVSSDNDQIIKFKDDLKIFKSSVSKKAKSNGNHPLKSRFHISVVEPVWIMNCISNFKFQETYNEELLHV